MPRTPEQYEEIRNEKKKIILDAALKLFANKGYSATSISQIAEAANISNGLMYNYFKSKEELLTDIVASFIDKLIKITDPNRNHILCEEDMMQLFDNYFELLMTRTEEAKLYTQLSVQPEVIKVISDALSKISKQEEIVFSYFAESQNAEMMMMNFEVIMHGLMMVYAFAHKDYPDELMLQYKNYIKKLFVR
jgi:Transcriptional regulator